MWIVIALIAATNEQRTSIILKMENKQIGEQTNKQNIKGLLNTNNQVLISTKRCFLLHKRNTSSVDIIKFKILRKLDSIEFHIKFLVYRKHIIYAMRF